MRGRKPLHVEPKSVGVFLRLTPGAKRELKRRAKVSGMSQSELVETWLASAWLTPDEWETVVGLLGSQTEVYRKSLEEKNLEISDAVWIRRTIVAIEGILKRLRKI